MWENQNNQKQNWVKQNLIWFKLLRFLLCHQEMIGNMSFWLTKMFCKEKKDLLEKFATITRFKYSPLGKELKAKNDIAKKQYHKFKYYVGFWKIIKKKKKKRKTNT